jgi:hypothetical protein
MQLFRWRHSFREVDMQRSAHKAIPAAMGFQRVSPREAFACNRQI